MSMQNSLLGYSVVTVHDYRLVPETECVYYRVNLMKKVDETSTQTEEREKNLLSIRLRPTKYAVLGKSHVFMRRTSQTVVWSTSCVV